MDMRHFLHLLANHISVALIVFFTYLLIGSSSFTGNCDKCRCNSEGFFYEV